ncbi:MAG: peroxidase-related enzyme [Candidatus Latescibacteria bacterium]|nr:peroxidase-related enzyme [Candidatus Latescibacterota bacterium]
MARFNMNKTPDNPQVQELYREIAEYGLQGVEEGTPLNTWTVLADRSDLLQGLWGLTKSVVISGSLPPTVKQMIAMTIAMQNNCRYCTVAHTHALEAMGVPTDVVKSCAADPDLADIPPSQRAILKFALKTTRDPRSVTDEDFQALQRHGLSDGEIMEVIMMAAWSDLLNTFTDVTQVPVDGEE